jgi:putative SOS response-associated peptidase YedK
MCGRIAISKDVDEMVTEFAAVTGKSVEEWRPGWNISPTDPIPIVIESTAGSDELHRRLEVGRWSLVPSWSKTLKLKYTTFNAVAEEVTTKASYRGAVKSHRALIPVSGFYEWKKDAGQTKGGRPFYIHPPEDEPLALAGLYSWWKDPERSDDDPELWTLTATILTSPAIDAVIDIHDRNPVPLPSHWWDDWLNPEIEGDQKFVDDAVAAAVEVADRLQLHEVSRAVSNGGRGKADGPELTQPI